MFIFFSERGRSTTNQQSQKHVDSKSGKVNMGPGGAYMPPALAPSGLGGSYVPPVAAPMGHGASPRGGSYVWDTQTGGLAHWNIDL